MITVAITTIAETTAITTITTTGSGLLLLSLLYGYSVSTIMTIATITTAVNTLKESVQVNTLFYFYAFSNWSLPTPHKGQTKSSGKSSHFVPAAIPLSGSPTASSYV